MSILPSQNPSVHITKYASGDHEIQLRLCRVSKGKQAGRKQGAVIREFSPESARRCLTAFRATAREFKVELCLTYPPEVHGMIDGRQSKKHLDRFIIQLKRKHPGILYAWVLEFQTKTENPHYHLLVNQHVDKDWLSLTWYRIVGTGLEKHLKAGTRVQEIRNQDRCADYMARYLTKMDQKAVPEWFCNVGRWWGMSRGLLDLHKVDVDVEYQQNRDARAATRPFRRARKVFLKHKYGIDWKTSGSRGYQGYTDRQTPAVVMERLIEDLISNLSPGHQ
jgi:hypothetical protein